MRTHIRARHGYKELCGIVLNYENDILKHMQIGEMFLDSCTLRISSQKATAIVQRTSNIETLVHKVR